MKNSRIKIHKKTHTRLTYGTASLLIVALAATLSSSPAHANSWITIHNNCGNHHKDIAVVTLDSANPSRCAISGSNPRTIPHKSKKSFEVSGVFCKYNIDITYYQKDSCHSGCKLPTQILQSPGTELSIERKGTNKCKIVGITPVQPT